MKYCGMCGNELQDNATFCGKCGSYVNNAQNDNTQQNFQQPYYNDQQNFQSDYNQQGYQTGYDQQYGYNPQNFQQPNFQQPNFQQVNYQQPQPVVNLDKEPTLLTVFNFITSALMAISVFIIIFTLATANINAGADVSGYYYYSIDAWAYLRFDFDVAIIGLLFGIAAFGCAITAFIVCMSKYRKLKSIFSTSLLMTIGLLVIILAGVLLD